MFYSNHRGFTLDFDNGYCLSVQWHMMAGCSARRDRSTLKSKTAEVCIIDPDEECVPLGNNSDVAGYISVANVAAVITELNTPCPDHDRIRKVLFD